MNGAFILDYVYPSLDQMTLTTKMKQTDSND